MMTEAALAALCPVAHAKACNAEINARALAEGWEFWTLAPEDAAFYVEGGYATALDYERAILIGSISDAHKEVYCGRPRGCYDWDAMSLDDLRALLDRLYESAAADAADEWMEAEEAEATYRDDVALGVTEADETIELEEWEIYEAKAEAAGYGAWA